MWLILERRLRVDGCRSWPGSAQKARPYAAARSRALAAPAAGAPLRSAPRGHTIQCRTVAAGVGSNPGDRARGHIAGRVLSGKYGLAMHESRGRRSASKSALQN